MRKVTSFARVISQLINVHRVAISSVKRLGGRSSEKILRGNLNSYLKTVFFFSFSIFAKRRTSRDTNDTPYDVSVDRYRKRTRLTKLPFRRLYSIYMQKQLNCIRSIFHFARPLSFLSTRGTFQGGIQGTTWAEHPLRYLLSTFRKRESRLLSVARKPTFKTRGNKCVSY